MFKHIPLEKQLMEERKKSIAVKIQTEKNLARSNHEREIFRRRHDAHPQPGQTESGAKTDSYVILLVRENPHADEISENIHRRTR